MISRSTLAFRVAALSLAAVVTSAVMLAVPGSQAEAATPPAPVTFHYTGNQTSWVVPANIASLQVEIAAASGVEVAVQYDPALGGTGGAFTVDLGTSFAGKTFQVLVGGQGHGSLINQGYSQQAGGGGTYLAVDDSFIAVAGGGGGAGYSFIPADANRVGLAGGFGGAATGGGNSAFMYSSAAVGQGAQGATPGFPGTGYCGPSCPYQGGAGTTASVANGVISSGAGGYGGHTCGGGGGGYAGGGGGSNNFDSTPNADYAGGGGGSGFLVSPLTASSTGTNTGDGFVTFTYTLATPVLTALTITPSQTSVAQGGSLTFAVTGSDQFGADMGDVSPMVTLTSDQPTDVVAGLTVSFPHASPHVITVTGTGGVTAAATVAVIPTVVPAVNPPIVPVKPVLAATGVDLGMIVPIGSIMLLLGGLALAMSRRRNFQ